MNIFVYQGGALFASENISSTAGIEINAGWERESEGKLIGERVLADFRNMKPGSLPLNSLCSSESIEKMISLRKLAVKVITATIKTGAISSESYTAAVVLKKMETGAVTPLSDGEKKLISASESTYMLCSTFESTGLTSSGSAPAEYAILLPVFISSISPAFKVRLSLNIIKTFSLSPRLITCSGERFDIEFADFYRLFLYVRDNSGNGKAVELTYHAASVRSIQFPYNSHQNKTSEKTFFTITHQGAFS